jgi:hypothetical protein
MKNEIVMKKEYVLQHKYPWETDWRDLKVGHSKYNDKFNNIIKDEPLHLIEVEYRVIKKVIIKLKSSDKAIVKPETVLIGKPLSDIVKEYNKG